MSLDNKLKTQWKVALLSIPATYLIFSLVGCADGYNLPKQDDYKSIKILSDINGDGINDIQGTRYDGTIDTILSGPELQYKIK